MSEACETCGDTPCEHFRALVNTLDAQIREMTARALGHAYAAQMAEGGESIQSQELARERADHAETRETLRGLRAWAKSRIEHCRAGETKFGVAWQIGARHGPPQALVEAWQERRTLEAVLRMLEES